MERKGKKIAVWILSGLLAALFLMSGGSKLAGAEQRPGVIVPARLAKIGVQVDF